MPLPSEREIAIPLLHLTYAKGGMIIPKEAVNILKRYFNLTEVEISQKYQNTRENIFNNRIRWARNALCKRGLFLRESYGQWKISEEGKAVIKEFGLDSIPFPSPERYSKLSEIVFGKKRQRKQENALGTIQKSEKKSYPYQDNGIDNEEYIFSIVRKKIIGENIKKFPEDFIPKDYQGDFYEIPLPGVKLQIDKFFDSLIKSEIGHFRYEAKNKAEAKYIFYGHEIGKKFICIPKDPLILFRTVKEYENYRKNLEDKIFNLVLELINSDNLMAEKITKQIIEKLDLKTVI